MRRLAALLMLMTALALAAKVDVRIVTSSNPENSEAYVALVSFVKTWPEALKYLPNPSDWSVGMGLTSPPNPKTFSGILLVFDNNASTGNITRDKELANAYINNVILPAIRDKLRIGIIVGPKSTLGQLVLYRLGLLIPTVPKNVSGRLVAVPACAENVKPLRPTGVHPIYSNVSALPSSCCMVSLVPDLVAPESIASDNKYCVVIRTNKISDEMIILSWADIFRDVAGNPNVQKLLLNVVKYLAKEESAKYPYQPLTVTVTSTVTLTEFETLTHNVTIIVTSPLTLTTTVTVSNTVTVTKAVINNVTVIKTVTTTVYETVTSLLTVTSTLLKNITSTYSVTTTVTSEVLRTVTSTINKTIMTTITNIKKVVDAATLGAALVLGIVVGIIVMLVTLRRGERGRGKSVLEEW